MQQIELDMGCGKGSYALQLAERFPDRLIVASDVMLGRLRKLARRAGRRGLTNLRILRASHFELVGFQLPDNAVCRLHLLCPDPWPKQRHRGRRLTASDFLGRAARVIEPNGTLHVATDDVAYLSDITSLVERMPMFEPDPELARLRDILDLRTDFEQQWINRGRDVPHVSYRVCKRG